MKISRCLASPVLLSVVTVLVLATLAIVVLLFGVWPAPILEVMHPSVDNLIQHLVQSKL